METREERSAGTSVTTPEDGSADAPARILEAAGPIFARDGYERATLREICRSAETNVALVAYYFGDKRGLYRAVIRQVREAREREYPVPTDDGGDPNRRLYQLVDTLLRRMLACDESSWHAQLMMREMNSPTEVFRELVEDYFRPLFRALTATLRELIGGEAEEHRIEQLAFSAVGQCLYYRVGAGVLQVLIPEAERRAHYGNEALARHITAVLLSAVHDLKGRTGASLFALWCDATPPAPNHASEFPFPGQTS